MRLTSALCLRAAGLVLLAGLAPMGSAGERQARSVDELHRLVETVRSDFARTRDYTGFDQPSDAVVAAMLRVPRHEYVPRQARAQAYVNRPLPIGHGQTISQPFIVALMTHALSLTGTDRVLEIGTGSGYQAAVLAELAKEVYTIEIVAKLAEEARARLSRMNYRNVEVRDGDGWLGWPDAAPFDAVIVTAAGPQIPPKLVQQLRPGGRLIMPVGEPDQGQMLTLVQKHVNGSTTAQALLPVIFVPLTGGTD